MIPRTFLFLQGVATPFFRELSAAIRKEGHHAYRVNFCGGDSLFSERKNTWRYNRPPDELPSWLAEKHQQYQFTDVVLFGDTRPLHKEAKAFLREQNIRTYVFEEGYLRPYWITLELEGVNGHSGLMNKPSGFWENTPYPTTDKPQQTGNTFTQRAIYDIKYRLANAAFKPLYRHYRTHRPVNALVEYAGWAKRLPAVKLWHSKRENKLINQLVESKTPYFLFPLQLDADSQIRTHSPYDSVHESIKDVISSFAKHAPADSKLVIKNHPLATGVINHFRQVEKLRETYKLHDRIVFLQSGHLPTLLDHTRGTILVNSTTGTSALFHQSPVCALGTAVFNLPGLTFQHGLDRFWTEGKAPDRSLFNNFRSLLIQHSQINGDFYSKKGIELAVAGSLKRMNVQTVIQDAQVYETPSPSANTLSVEPVPVATFSYGMKLPGNAYQYKNTD